MYLITLICNSNKYETWQKKKRKKECIMLQNSRSKMYKKELEKLHFLFYKLIKFLHDVKKIYFECVWVSSYLIIQ